MKPLRPSMKWILAAIGFFLALLVLEIIVFWTAKPKVTVDYVAEYNRMTRPQDFDPNENAAEFYQKAIDSFTEMPVELQTRYLNKPQDFNDANNYSPRGGFRISREFKMRHIDWPADFGDANQNTLKEWLTLNEQAFERFRNASRKPYYWFERGISEDVGMSGMLFPELAPLRSLVEAMIWNAKLQSTEGRVQAGFEDILACYRAGLHKCRTPSLQIDQLLGFGAKEKALIAAICILDRVKIDPTDLKTFQDALQAEFNKDVCFPDFEAEKILLYDKLQRTFIDNGKGSGRLAWSVVKGIGTMCGSSENLKFRKAMFLSCLFGPTKNEMIKRIEETFALFASAIPQTPWQLHSQDPNYFEKLNTTPCDDCGYFSFDIFFPTPSPRLFYKYYEVKAREGHYLRFSQFSVLERRRNRFHLRSMNLFLRDTCYIFRATLIVMGRWCIDPKKTVSRFIVLEKISKMTAERNLIRPLQIHLGILFSGLLKNLGSELNALTNQKT